ncbi:unnamed protein product [Prorocentrum cordatum]|uniref:Amidohydrolase 3 domain-containing protein n=1 Tax=Prorocentrum cordatum TaxID=2364126 RepID=A0ABN9TEF4_9DINO|nr:unnamed protein product [Polarella glacialis]
MDSEQAMREPFDIVLAGGRVIDPETGTDDVMDVALRGTRIERVVPVSAEELPSKRRVDCTGLVVCPGFIDTHAHSSGHRPSARIQVMDGVTMHLELEFGHHPVEAWYDRVAREGGAVIHYGASAGHIMARIAAFECDENAAVPDEPPDKRARREELRRSRGLDAQGLVNCNPHLLLGCACCGAPSHQIVATRDDVQQILANIEASLDQGGLGIGMGIAYTEKADHEEVYRVFEMAARRKCVVFVHNRGEMRQLSDMHEVFADAAATGASLVVCHIASSTGNNVNLPLTLEMIDRLNERNAADITCEQYPYTAGMTRLESGVFNDGWRERLGIDYSDVEWIGTGERLKDEADFLSKRAATGLVCIHSIPDASVDLCMQHPRCLIASDAIPFDEEGRGHPRSAGCFSRVLRVYVRERKLISLMEAIRKMTLGPAKKLEPICSAFKAKARIQEGCDADICVFDPDHITDNATFQSAATPSSGIVHVLVNGHFVVQNGAFVECAVGYGEPIRADTKHCFSNAAQAEVL